ncbi:Cytoplasmic GTPase/eEF2-like protein (ribosomal biogenesis) [Malassezia cuniculi]|uniref:Cytoplasmic GTPase/eEF2-like protein (Ribosomal biogenesis) n=1 Tax=Malassezia cuniculi TaxID=948313 RepID=A0AAF0ETR3_9BASI|nr:Cytoplasmic GTPase/eEF2-like protein (ribosomal biogenesis) [Malassezia cuniculi]
MPTAVAFSSRNVRCCTIIGHVDHGKSAYADSLLAANGIISASSAGSTRYLDHRTDERERGITIESSAVSLVFKMRTIKDDAVASIEDYSLNIVDTPGHNEFAYEVSASSRLCDGALLIVDVVEGVAPQTVAVLRQAWEDRLSIVLVLNKMDRLIEELEFTPAAAHSHLVHLVEQVNAIIAGFFNEERIKRQQRNQDADEDIDDSNLYFNPVRGNVIFASATHRWAFRLDKFVMMYAQKLGAKEDTLRKFMWGDYYFDPKNKRVLTSQQKGSRNLKPLFVQFVLDNVWSVYDSLYLNRDADKAARIVEALGVKVSPAELQASTGRGPVIAVMSRWHPIFATTFAAIVQQIPAPHEAQRTRVPHMLRPDLDYFAKDDALEPRNDIERDMFNARTQDDATAVAYVSRMFVPSPDGMPQDDEDVQSLEMRNVQRTIRQQRRLAGAVDDSDEKSLDVLGFARLYSGTLRRGDKVWAVLPKYDPELGPNDPANAPYLRSITITSLYLHLGSDLIQVKEVPAGNVFSIRGLEGTIMRNGTLIMPPGGATDTPPADIVNMACVQHSHTPVLRVALEPVNPGDMPKLDEGLRLLNLADPCVETFIQDTGERVILTLGEMHLERCLYDLRERFSRVPIQASPPLVPFRETAVRAADMNPPKTAGAARGTMQGTAVQDKVSYSIRAVPLPAVVSEFLVVNQNTLLQLRRGSTQETYDPTANAYVRTAAVYHDADTPDAHQVPPNEFFDAFAKVLESAGPEWAGRSVYAFGPHGTGPNLLIDATGKLRRQRGGDIAERMESTLLNGVSREVADALEQGFQMATASGPLCAEPMQGMAFIVEELDQSEIDRAQLSQVTSSLISGVREACRNGLLDWSPRLMLAMYLCEIHQIVTEAQSEFEFIAQCGGRVVSQYVQDSSPVLTTVVLIPIVDSINSLRRLRRTGSAAVRKTMSNAQMMFAGFHVFDQDPFWVPRTEEELEDLGEKSDRENRAKQYMDSVRRRKGLFTGDRLVAGAEKQRTLKSN